MLFDRLADLLERERRIVGRADAYQNVHAIIVVANDIHLCGAYRLAQVPEAEIAQDAGDRDVIFAELIRIDGQSVRHVPWSVRASLSRTISNPQVRMNAVSPMKT